MISDTLNEWVTHDYYATLDVPTDATQGDIARAFRRLARRHHPDTSASPDPVAFQRASDAYQVLSDVWARDRYDRFREARRRVPTQRMDHQDVPEEDRWVAHASMTMSMGGLQYGFYRGTGTSMWAMNPWLQFYRRAWGL